MLKPKFYLFILSEIFALFVWVDRAQHCCVQHDEARILIQIIELWGQYYLKDPKLKEMNILKAFVTCFSKCFPAKSGVPFNQHVIIL